MTAKGLHLKIGNWKLVADAVSAPTVEEIAPVMPDLKNPNSPSAPDPLREAAMKEIADVLQSLGTGPNGLTEEEATTRLAQHGPNEVAHEKQQGWLERFGIAARNPLVILLTILAVISFGKYVLAKPEDKDVTDVFSGVVMLLMVFLGLLLRFVQETRADNAAAKLKAMISVTATAARYRALMPRSR